MIRVIPLSVEQAAIIPCERIDLDTRSNRHTDEAAWSRAYIFVRDIDNNAIVIMHGTPDGYLVINGQKYYAYAVFDHLVDQGLMQRHETLNVVCCHGRTVCDRLRSDPTPSGVEYHMHFLNTTTEEASVMVVHSGGHDALVVSSSNCISLRLGVMRAAFTLRRRA